jgi:triosephosphate isomerase
MRTKIIAGNWKMNLNFSDAEDLLADILDLLEKTQQKNGKSFDEMIICPPFPYLELAGDIFLEEDKVMIGAQNVSAYQNGAYTGEISAMMLESLSAEYCIVGHSERRKYFSESDQDILIKAQNLLEYDIQPIICCGEILEERETNKHFEVIEKQLKAAVFPLKESLNEVIIAYEPVWAIGTGKTASPEQAQEMHAFIRSLIRKECGDERADSIPILYGGSCNAQNAKELFSCPDVDGGLIGGASLKAKDFIEIANSF